MRLPARRSGRAGGLSLAAVALLLCAGAGGAAAARALSAAPPAAPQQLHIVHINDVHNRIEQTAPGSSACLEEDAAKGKCLGGWGRITTAVEDARKAAAEEGAAFLFLDAGDEFDGSLWDVVYPGSATAVMQNIAKPDVMTLGNHEFSFPPSVLRAYTKNLTFPMLGGCNVRPTKQPALQGLFKNYTVVRAGPYKIGIVGWLTPDTAFTAKHTDGITFEEVNPAVKRCVAQLKKEHPDVHMIIGMSHTGYDEDLKTAQEVPELDLIVGGHSHTFLNTPNNTGPIFDKTKRANASTCVEKRVCDEPTGPYPTFVSAKACTGAGKCAAKSIPVVQAYYASKYLGTLKFDLPTKKFIEGRPVLLGGPNSTNPVDPDPRIMAAIKKLEAPIRALESRKEGKITEMLIGGKPGRKQETNFGSYLAGLLVRSCSVKDMPSFRKKYGPVNIGLINAGAIRADIEPPTVSYGEVLTALPFLNTLAIKSLTGQQLKDTLAYGLSGIEEGEGRFLQVAGLRLWHRGPKLVAAKLLDNNGTTSPIDPDANYNVATLDYLANGGDGFKDLEKAPSLMALGRQIDELMFADLKASSPNPIDVPNPAKDPRIINCAAPTVDCSNKELYGPCCASEAGNKKRRLRARRRARSSLRR